jgi:hypothetical protein
MKFCLIRVDTAHNLQVLDAIELCQFTHVHPFSPLHTSSVTGPKFSTTSVPHQIQLTTCTFAKLSLSHLAGLSLFCPQQSSLQLLAKYFKAPIYFYVTCIFYPVPHQFLLFHYSFTQTTML